MKVNKAPRIGSKGKCAKNGTKKSLPNRKGIYLWYDYTKLRDRVRISQTAAIHLVEDASM